MAYRKGRAAACRPPPASPRKSSPSGSRHEAVDQAVARRARFAAPAGLRDSVPRHECVLAVDGRRHVRLRLAVLDDLQGKSLGAQVRKGEKSTIAIFYKSYTKRWKPDLAKRPTRPAGCSKPIRCSMRSIEGLPGASIRLQRWSWSSLKGARRTRRRFARHPRRRAPGLRGLLQADWDHHDAACRSCLAASTTTAPLAHDCRTGPAMPAAWARDLKNRFGATLPPHRRGTK
jgi:hypothetical protein